MQYNQYVRVITDRSHSIPVWKGRQELFSNIFVKRFGWLSTILAGFAHTAQCSRKPYDQGTTGLLRMCLDHIGIRAHTLIEWEYLATISPLYASTDRDDVSLFHGRALVDWHPATVLVTAVKPRTLPTRLFPPSGLARYSLFRGPLGPVSWAGCL